MEKEGVTMITRIKCAGCGRVKVVQVDEHDPSEQDLAAAEPGEFIDYICSRCGSITDHEVLADAQMLA